MQAFIYYISLPFIYFISILPFWLLYRVSDFLFFLIYFVFGYRKKVVLQNLKNSFPEKSDEEINEICKKFYVFFCDLIVETIKTLTISRKQAIKRCSFKDLTLLDRLYSEKKKIIFAMGHYGNWELGGSGSSQHPYKLHVIYSPLSNKYFNDLIIKMRTRLDTKLITMKDTFREMIAARDNDEISATAFIADQTGSINNSYWTTFLNQDTAVFWGTEIIASKLNYPIVYLSIDRIRRGYYEMNTEMLCENPAETKEGEISELHTRKLEEIIIKKPELWLWTHKRWKHKKPN